MWSYLLALYKVSILVGSQVWSYPLSPHSSPFLPSFPVQGFLRVIPVPLAAILQPYYCHNPVLLPHPLEPTLSQLAYFWYSFHDFVAICVMRSNVNTMWNMFHHAYEFNGVISGWHVSKVIKMSNIFGSTKVFNQDLSKWDVSNVEDMNGVFSGAVAFNQPLSEWDVSKVKHMHNMFYSSARVFDQDLSK